MAIATKPSVPKAEVKHTEKKQTEEKLPHKKRVKEHLMANATKPSALKAEEKQSKEKQSKEKQTEGKQTEEKQTKEKQTEEKQTEEKLPYKKRVKEHLMVKCLDTLLGQHEKANQTTDESGRTSVFALTGPSTSKDPIHLVIQSFKIPYAVPRSKNRPVHPKIYRFSVPHSLTDGVSGVLLVTKDYPKKGKPTAISNAHYLDMITTAGCNHLITEIMSVSQLASEYSEQEARKELCRRIDVVLCDQPCVNIVPRLLGHHFLKAKKFPISVKLESNKLRKELEKKLSTATHKMTFRNTESSLTFGHTGLSPNQLFDNLTAAMKHLCSEFPGGWPNVKTLYLSVGLKTRVPLFISRANISSVPSASVAAKGKIGEHMVGDFGFGPVRLSSSLKVVDYVPMSDDEEAFVHGNKYNFRKNKVKRAEREEKLAKKKAERSAKRKASRDRKALQKEETAPPSKKRKTSSGGDQKATVTLTKGNKRVATPSKDSDSSQNKVKKNKNKKAKTMQPARIHTTVLEDDFM